MSCFAVVSSNLLETQRTSKHDLVAVVNDYDNGYIFVKKNK